MIDAGAGLALLEQGMRVILMAVALCALAFVLNLVGDFSSSASPAAVAVNVAIPPSKAAAPGPASLTQP